MNPNKELWEKGDFTQLAATMRNSGQKLVDSFNVKPGMNVLDIGCGDGTTAIPEAKSGANVLGVDISSKMVKAGNLRAANERLTNIRFEEGDACDLKNVQSGNFDLVVSIFGAMFAPNPFDVAKEMVRVTRPGGKIIMGNWIPGDPTLVAEILKICSQYTPQPPHGFISPMLWGIEGQVIERFGEAGIPKENISFLRDEFVFEAAYPPTVFLEKFRDYYGPTMNAYEAAEKNQKATGLQTELERLFIAHNQGDSNQTSIPAGFMRVTVQC